MAVQVQLCFLLFGTCLFSFLLLLECRKLEGYDFPVFSTKKCPGNQAEWKKRSSAINCTEQNGYMCLPNENLTDLLEFCYIYPRILVQQDLCLYLDKRFSKVNSYNCRRFSHGCPELHYFSSDTYLHPSCMQIENGCFSAEPGCKRKPLRSEHSFDATTLAINLGVSIPICLLCILAFSVIGFKYGICNKRSDTVRGDEETELLCGYENKESLLDNAVFEHWENNEKWFIPTRACELVENKIVTQNVVIVTGHSGSGKSAIIQHIALKYRKKDWIVKRVKDIEDIANTHFRRTNILFVFDDPLGKESLDEILHDKWQRYEEGLPIYLIYAKLLMACRKTVLSDKKVKGLLNDLSNVVDINNSCCKLTKDEKISILKSYKIDAIFSEEECAEIVQIEEYFPLLCKLYSKRSEGEIKSLKFFKEPFEVLAEEIRNIRNLNNEQYCALILIIIFNNSLCVDDIPKNSDSVRKFKHALNICGMHTHTALYRIRDNLESLKGILVEKINDIYQFYNDFVMKVTTFIVGVDYPRTVIKYAGAGFLRRQVRLERCNENPENCTIYLTYRHINDLGERLYSEIFGEQLLDVVLNPCLQNENVKKVFEENLKSNLENRHLLLAKKKLLIDKQIIYQKSAQLDLSKLAFVRLENEIACLFALIVFGHTDLSLHCLQILKDTEVNLTGNSLFPAVCCNGSVELFNWFLKDNGDCLIEKWGGLSPIHIVTMFNNSEILEKLCEIGSVDVNEVTGNVNEQISLIISTEKDTLIHADHQKEKSNGMHTNTKQFLKTNIKDIDPCLKAGVSPLHIACCAGSNELIRILINRGANVNHKNSGTTPFLISCENGHNSTVQLLLSNGADIELCDENGKSPLYKACQNGHDSTVQLLLSNGADINLCDQNGHSPLYIACQNGHESTLLLLLSNGADINLCDQNGHSPLYIACQNGHESTVQLLLSNGADINLCDQNGHSPLYIACQNGHESTLLLLLSNGADINLCDENGHSPLYIACQNGHESTLLLLLSNGADINLCDQNGLSPLYIACQNGHDSTVQLLLSNGADINLCKKYGVSILFIAFVWRRYKTVNILLNNGVDTSLACGWKVNPALINSFDEYESTVDFLLQKDNIQNNMYDPDSFFSLFVSCQVERVTRMIFDK